MSRIAARSAWCHSRGAISSSSSSPSSYRPISSFLHTRSPPSSAPSTLLSPRRTATTTASLRNPCLRKEFSPSFSSSKAPFFFSSFRQEKPLGSTGIKQADVVSFAFSVLRRRDHQSGRRYYSSSSSDSSSSSSSSSSDSSSLPPLPPKFYPTHLYLTSALVVLLVAIGGLTRLTESGLSITEWNLITGFLPPLTQNSWLEEFSKYKNTPEWEKLNFNLGMGLDEFKNIYWMEWGHRFLGRIVGLVFLIPISYYMISKPHRRYFISNKGKNLIPLITIGLLIGGQGALGWYMVRSGLDRDQLSKSPNPDVPRVSHYRLAAHLGMAFLVAVGSLRWGIRASRELAIGKALRGGNNNGLEGAAAVAATTKWGGIEAERILQGGPAKKARIFINSVTGIVFVTAMSGALVAGLDAGLIYNEFPYMGEGIVPPSKELFNPRYSRPDSEKHWWRNFFDNPTTVQFDHRVLAMTSLTSILTLRYILLPTKYLTLHSLPPITIRLIKSSLHATLFQVVLGISTLIYLVPTPLAALHQVNSLVVLGCLVGAGAGVSKFRIVGGGKGMKAAGVIPMGLVTMKKIGDDGDGDGEEEEVVESSRKIMQMESTSTSRLGRFDLMPKKFEI